jgi:hypothetical protein
MLYYNLDEKTIFCLSLVYIDGGDFAYDIFRFGIDPFLFFEIVTPRIFYYQK